MSFYIGYFGWLLTIAAFIFINWYRWKKLKIRPNYFAVTQWRVFWGIVFLIILSSEKNFDPFNDFWYQMFKVWAEVVYISTSFYLFFDPVLNKAMKKEIDYRGEKSGWIDPSLTAAMWWAGKIVCLIACIYSSIMLWRN